MSWNHTLQTIKQNFETLGASVAEDLKRSWMQKKLSEKAWKTLAQVGFMSFMAQPKEQIIADLPKFCAAYEGFAKGNRDVGFTVPVLVHSFMAVPTVYRYATPEAKEKYLQGLKDGSFIAAFAVTEPQGGSKINPSLCTLQATENHYLLNGKKWHITNAPGCTHIIAWVQSPENPKDLCAVIVPSRTKGIHIEQIDTMSTGSGPVGQITFEDVHIPKEDVILFPGSGKRILQDILMNERTMCIFPAIGLMESMVELSLKYVSQRKIDGKPVIVHQHVQRRIVDMTVMLEQARAISQQVLKLLRQGKDITREASISKMITSDYTMKCAIEAGKVAGTYGLLTEAQFPMHVLDALGCTVGGGTEEIHRTIVNFTLCRELAEDRLYRDNTLPQWTNAELQTQLFSGATR